MNPKQTIVWTALPNGINEQGRAKLSVLVSPRLEGRRQVSGLQVFPDFVNWPESVQGIEFIASIDGYPKTISLEPDFKLDGDLWGKIFTEGVLVYNHQFTDLKDQKLRSYPVRALLKYLHDKYDKWGELGLAIPPDIKTLDQNKFFNLLRHSPILAMDERNHELEVKLQREFALTVSDDDGWNFWQLHNFYNRGLSDTPNRPTIPDFDFHQGVALLADHPTLMRALGLVLDFTMELPKDKTGIVRVIPSWQPKLVTRDVSPDTYYWYDNLKNEFLPRWREDGDLRHGFLDLAGVQNVFDVFEQEQTDFDLVQVDPDGSLLKLMHFSYAMQGLMIKDEDEMIKTYPLGMERETALPGLRSGGLGLVRKDRAVKLHQHLSLMSGINQFFQDGSGIEEKDFFHADELLRGYRVDVEDLTLGKIRSLCWRTGHYLFRTGQKVPLKKEEGYVKSASTTSQDDVANELYLHELLFRWNGWSLCAERPHMTIVPASIPENDPGTGRYENVMQTQSVPMGEIDLKPVLEALPGSLPRLRFGHQYRMRVRAVDVAGNSLPTDHPGWNQATNPITYKRYEPVASPTLVLRDKLRAGEGIERMVIRSNFNKRALLDNQRHVAPPKTSQEMAETHGQFDSYIGGKKDYKQGYNIAIKEAGTLNDKKIVDVRTGRLRDLPGANQITYHEITTDGGETTEIVIHGEEQLDLPYLPDPMAAGTAIQGIPRLSSSWLPGLEKVIDEKIPLAVVKVPFTFNLSWPNALCFRLKLAERRGRMSGSNCQQSFTNDSTQQAQWDAKRRVLSIHLAKAEKVTLRYSSYIKIEHKDLFAVWDWLKNNTNAEIFLNAGSIWMITPHRKLELVHAVQQPLCEPRFDRGVKAEKIMMGQTGVNFVGTATLNAWSTEKIDLMAEWDEWDDTDRDGPKRITGLRAHACEGIIAYNEINTRNLNLDPHNLTHEFGDTRHRWVNYHLVATSRFREYFEPKGEPMDFTRVGPVRKLNIQNSARPAAPKVQYIVPSFGWKRSIEGHTLTSIRLGGGLRIYMDRPWFSSGDDELLGVVLPHAPSNPPQQIPEYMQPYVTQCGLDPIWETSNPQKTTNLTHSDFKGYENHGANYSLEELADVNQPKNVDVVGYEPEYNQERKLWFCDVQFNPDRLTTYYPFVRLGLARFQPHSIPDSDAFLSQVVMTDYVQLVPTRELKVSKTTSLKNIIEFGVTLSGYAPKFSGENDPPTLITNEVTVTLEMHDRSIPGELGWKPFSTMLPNNLNKDLLSSSILNNFGGTTQSPGYYNLTASSSQGNPDLWTWNRNIQLPKQLFLLKESFRFVVREYEHYWADGERDTSSNELTRKVEKRVVYTDIVALNEIL